MPQIRRLVAVAAILTTALISTAVVNAAADPASSPSAVSCSLLTDEFRVSGAECRPLTHHGAGGLFLARTSADERPSEGEGSPGDDESSGDEQPSRDEESSGDEQAESREPSEGEESTRNEETAGDEGSSKSKESSGDDQGESREPSEGEESEGDETAGAGDTSSGGEESSGAGEPSEAKESSQAEESHEATPSSGAERPTGAAPSAAPTTSTSAPSSCTSGPAAKPGGANDTGSRHPADILDLTNWNLTLPTGTAGHPDTVDNPELATFSNEAFAVSDAGDGVVFSATAGGVTTENSKYARSELREMDGGEKAAWTNTSGTHTLEVCQAITKVPRAKPELVAAQIHDGNDDVVQIRLEDRALVAQYADGASQVIIDPDYALGTPYQVRIVAADRRVVVFYDGEQKAELPLEGSGWYWKVGAYVQSNTSTGDDAGAVGEVVVHSLKAVHASGSR